MPRLNLKDEGLDAEGAPESSKSPSPTPALREVGGSSGKISPLILIGLIIVVLAGGIYALNHFKVIRLWGKKAPVVTETLPESDIPVAPQAQEPLPEQQVLKPCLSRALEMTQRPPPQPRSNRLSLAHQAVPADTPCSSQHG